MKATYAMARFDRQCCIVKEEGKGMYFYFYFLGLGLFCLAGSQSGDSLTKLDNYNYNYTRSFYPSSAHDHASHCKTMTDPPL